MNLSPRAKGRIAGLLYLIVIVGGLFAELYVRGRLVVSGDAATTAHNIVAHEGLYRLGFVVELFYLACNIPITLIFWDVFRVVSWRATLLIVFFSLVGTAIEGASLLFHFAPLMLLGGSPALSTIPLPELQALAYMSLQMFERGFAICLVFFGFYCITIGYMIVRSRFLPRIIGGLVAIQGAAYLVNSFAVFLAPPFAARVFPFLMVSALGEISLCLWLLGMGFDPRRWHERAEAALARRESFAGA